MNYILRDGRKEEARDFAILVNHAGTGPNNKGLDYVGWSQESNEGEGPFDYGCRIIESMDGQYSYHNIRALEVDGKLGIAYITPKKILRKILMCNGVFMN